MGKGKTMREIDLIVVHCSATREDRDFTEHDLEVCHRRREGRADCVYPSGGEDRGACKGIQSEKYRRLL